MQRLNLDPASLVALETYTRYVSTLLSTIVEKKASPLDERAQHQLHAAEDLIERLFIAIGDYPQEPLGSVFGVSYASDDEVDASLFYAVKAWESAGKPPEQPEIRDRLEDYRTTLSRLLNPAAAPRPSMAKLREVRDFFSSYNRVLGAYAAV